MNAMTMKAELGQAKTYLYDQKDDTQDEDLKKNEAFKILKKFNFAKKVIEPFEVENEKAEAKAKEMLLSEFSHFITVKEITKIAKKYGMLLIEPNFFAGHIGPNTVEALKKIDKKKYHVFIFCPMELTTIFQEWEETGEHEFWLDKDPFLLVVPKILEKKKDWVCAVADEWGNDITQERVEELKRKDEYYSFLDKANRIIEKITAPVLLPLVGMFFLGATLIFSNPPFSPIISKILLFLPIILISFFVFIGFKIKKNYYKEYSILKRWGQLREQFCGKFILNLKYTSRDPFSSMQLPEKGANFFSEVVKPNVGSNERQALLI